MNQFIIKQFRFEEEILELLDNQADYDRVELQAKVSAIVKKIADENKLLWEEKLFGENHLYGEEKLLFGGKEKLYGLTVTGVLIVVVVVTFILGALCYW